MYRLDECLGLCLSCNLFTTLKLLSKELGSLCTTPKL